MITVGIPVYNQAEYLADSIESALSQTYPCEVIVCDDGSTDGSLEIAGRYPVKVISQSNRGLPAARNSLIMSMHGEYFLPLDSDDILLPGCVEKMEEEIAENRADVVAPSFKQFGVHNSEVILKGIPSLSDFRTANRLPYFCAIKKEVLLEIGGYSPRMLWGWEDYDLWIDIFKRGHSLSVLEEVLVLYRTKERSMIHEANEHAEDLRAQMAKNHPGICT